MMKLILILCTISMQITFCHNPISIDNVNRSFGVWAISKELYNYIITILEPGKTILELGSGGGTAELAKSFVMYSIEHDKKWLNKFKTNYIYAPIKNGWYDVAILEKKIPKKYDLILVDGPTGIIGRHGFLDNIKLFNTDVPIIFDDVERKSEFMLMQKTANLLQRKPIILGKSKHKKFGIILPK